jgi:hypothetical protein
VCSRVMSSCVLNMVTRGCGGHVLVGQWRVWFTVAVVGWWYTLPRGEGLYAPALDHTA